MRYATIVKRDPILKDFFSKLKLFADQGEIAHLPGRTPVTLQSAARLG